MVRRALIALSLLITLVVVACGPGGGASAQPGGSSPASAPSSAPSGRDGY